MTKHGDGEATASPFGPSPAVSVCIPTYNGATHVAQAIESVLSQSFDDWELVVVDDRSTDATVEVIQKFSHPRVRLICNHENLGPGANWNKAMAEGRGRFLKLMTQDDLLYPTSLERQVEVLEEHREVALVCSPRDIIDGRGRVLLRGRGPAALRGEVGREAVIQAAARAGTNPIGEGAAVLFRAELAAKAGGFDTGLPYVMDIDFWLRLLQFGSLFALDESLSAFRVAAGSWSTVLARRQAAEVRTFLRHLREQSPGVVGVWDLRVGLARAGLLGLGRRALYAWIGLRR